MEKYLKEFLELIDSIPNPEHLLEDTEKAIFKIIVEKAITRIREQEKYNYRNKQEKYDKIVGEAYKELNDTIEKAKMELEEIKARASEKYKKAVEKARNDSY